MPLLNKRSRLMQACKRKTMVPAAVAALVFSWPSSVMAADGAAGPDAKEVQAVLNKAAGFLKRQQGEDGSFAAKVAGPGVSALVAAGLLRNGHGPDEPVVAKTL